MTLHPAPGRPAQPEMTDEHLQRLLHAALPPIPDGLPADDAWPRVVARVDVRPTWTPFDLALAAGIALALLLLPQTLFVLALHF